MSALKKVKEPPLLSPPLMDRDWIIMTPADVRLMQVGLGEYRNKREWHRVLSRLYYMNALGLKVEATDEDKVGIGELLNRHRETGSGDWMAETHYWMKGLGLFEGLTERDRETMYEYVDKLRKHTWGPWGYPMFYMMEEVGAPVRAEQEDREGVIRWLQETRHGPTGESILNAHYTCKRLGFPQQATDSDIVYIRGQLQEAREEKAYYCLPQMLYWIKELSPSWGDIREPHEMPSIPPLKRFRR